MTIGERLKFVRENDGLTREVMAERLGIHKNTLGSYENGKSFPDSEVLNKLLQIFPTISPAWLLTGEGPEKKAETDHSSAAGELAPPGLTPLSPDDCVILPVYVTAGAGDPRELIPADPIEEIIIPKALYSPSIVPVKVEGRSMEKTLKDGSVVGVDRTDRRVVNGELYAVWLPYQGTVIKRLYLDNKKVLLQSDNEEFHHRDIEVDIAEVDEHFIQGRVKWAIQML